MDYKLPDEAESVVRVQEHSLGHRIKIRVLDNNIRGRFLSSSSSEPYSSKFISGLKDLRLLQTTFKYKTRTRFQNDLTKKNLP